MAPRELFLRGVWACIPDDRNTKWVANVAKHTRDNKPLGDYGEIVRRMLDAGISEGEIARFAKIIGYETAFQIMYLLSDPNAAYEGFPAEERQLGFGLQAHDAKTEEPVAQLIGLHESILSMDPSGREMRPDRK